MDVDPQVDPQEVDPQVVICLLALRQLGGRDIDPKLDLFTRGLKTALQQALDGQLACKEKLTIRSLGPGNKLKRASKEVLRLTDKGEAFLKRHAHPEGYAASATGQLTGLREQLEIDRQDLVAAAQASMHSGGKTNADGLAKEVGALTKSVGDLLKRLERLEAQLQGASSEPVAQKLDQAFATLTQKLTDVPAGVWRPAAPAPAPAPTRPEAAAPAEPGAEDASAMQESPADASSAHDEPQNQGAPAAHAHGNGDASHSQMPPQGGDQDTSHAPVAAEASPEHAPEHASEPNQPG